MSTATIAERVARGARLLDREKPGWAAKINDEELDLGLCDQCILGQIYGEYCCGRDALKLRTEPHRWVDELAAEHGFHHAERMRISVYDDDWEVALQADSAALDAEYADLATAWLAEIRARLAPQLLPLSPLVGAEMANYVEMVP